MLAFSRVKWIALTGYALAFTGIILYTQLGWIVNLRVGDKVLDIAVLCSMAVTFGGFLTAIVGSTIWARRIPTRQPLKIAVAMGVGALLLGLVVGVNVHGPSAMLMVVLPFSVVNVLSLLIVTQW